MFSAQEQKNGETQKKPFMLESGRKVKIHLSEEEYEHHLPVAIHSFVDRKSEEGESMMVSTHLRGFIAPGASFNLQAMMKMENPVRISADDSILSNHASISFKAIWFDADEKPATAAAGANVFGSFGTFQVLHELETLEIPLNDGEKTSPSFLASFNAKLVAIDEEISSFNLSSVNFYLVTYKFHNQNIRDYTLRPDKGGGVFVETHDFPHIFMPMKKNCQGGLILGRKENNSLYTFSAFTIPFGYAMLVSENVIHSDSFLVGSYTASLSTEMTASTVLIRKTDNAIQNVVLKKFFSDDSSLFFKQKPLPDRIQTLSDVNEISEKPAAKGGM